MNIKETVGFLLECDRLEAFPRTGYLMRGVPRPETVAAHAFGVACWAMLLADAIPEADPEKVLRMAILHEMGEVKLSDIPYRGGLYLPPGAKETAEEKIAGDLLAPLGPWGEKSLALFREYLAGESLPARIVIVADKLQMMMKVLRYELAGQRGLDDFWSTAENYRDYALPFVGDLFVEIKSRRPK